MIYIYVAAPYSQPSQATNVRAAIAAADQLLSLGYAPYIPHLSHLWDLISPKGYEEWLRLDLGWIAKCDAVLRLPGDSPGACREVEEAHRLGIPVFERISSLVANRPNC